MTESIRERAQSFAEFMSSLPPEEIARVNKLTRSRPLLDQHLLAVVVSKEMSRHISARHRW